jgi:hypothetical protein
MSYEENVQSFPATAEGAFSAGKYAAELFLKDDYSIDGVTVDPSLEASYRAGFEAGLEAGLPSGDGDDEDEENEDEGEKNEG